MSGSIENLVEGIIDSLANVAAHSGSIFGESEAHTLSLQIQSFGAGVSSIAAAADEHPYIALIGLGIGVAVVALPGVGEATGAISEAAGALADYYGLSEEIAAGVAQAIQSAIISNGVAGFVKEIASYGAEIGQFVSSIASDAEGWYSGAFPVAGAEIPTDANTTWGESSGNETFNVYGTLASNTTPPPIVGTARANTNGSEILTNENGGTVTIFGVGLQSQSIGADGGFSVVANASTIIAASDGSLSVSAVLSGTGNQVDLDSSGDSLTDSSGGNIINFAGSGDTASGSGDSATFAGNNDRLDGNSNTITVNTGEIGFLGGTGDTVSATGATIALDANSSATLTGTGDTAFLNGNASSFTDNSGANTISIYGSGATASGAGDTVYFNNNNDRMDGSNNTITVGTGETGFLGGTGDTVSATGATVALDANASATLDGSGDNIDLNGNNTTFTDNGGGNVVQIFGAGDGITAASDVIDSAAGLGFSVGGGNDQIHLGTASSVTLMGSSGYTVTAANDAVTLTAETGATIYGSGDNVNGRSQDTITVAGASDQIGESGGTVIADGNTSFTVVGSNDAVSGVAGDTLGVQGINDVVGETGGVVNADTSTSLTVTGSNDTIYGVAGDTVGVQGGNDTVSETGGVVNADSATSLTVEGSSDQIVGLGGDTVGVKGTSDLVSESYGTVNTDGGTSVTVAGNSDQINGTSGDTIGVAGIGDVVTLSNGTLNLDPGANVVLNGSGNGISGAPGTYLTQNDSNGSRVTEFEPSQGENLEVFDQTGANGTGETSDNAVYYSDGDATLTIVDLTGTQTWVNITEFNQLATNGYLSQTVNNRNGTSIVGVSFSNGYTTVAAYSGPNGTGSPEGESGTIYPQYDGTGQFGSTGLPASPDYPIQFGNPGPPELFYAYGSGGDSADASSSAPASSSGVTAAPTSQTQDLATGGSRVTATDPVDGVTKATFLFSGAGGTGSLTDILLNPTGGQSIQEQLGNRTDTITLYHGTDGSGGIAETILNNRDGTSTVTIGKPGDGVATAIYTYAQANATGQLVSAVYHNSDGTAERFAFAHGALTSNVFTTARGQTVSVDQTTSGQGSPLSGTVASGTVESNAATVSRSALQTLQLIQAVAAFADERAQIETPQATQLSAHASDHQLAAAAA